MSILDILNATEESETTKEVIEEVKEPETTEAKIEETVAEEVIPATPEAVVEEVTKEAEAPAEKVKLTHKVDYLEFFNQHKKTFDAYEAEKSADYASMSPEELLRKSFKVKYPNLTEEDINEELRNKYGVGEDTEDYDSAEQLAYRSKVRKMKIDATEAIPELEKYRESISLPDFEVEVDVPEPETKAQETEAIDLEAEAEKRKEEDLKWRNETWKPEISNAVTSIDKITKTFEIAGIGAVDVDVDLSEEDKKSIAEYLGDWTYHPTDNKYVSAEGNVDLAGFVKDRATSVIMDKFVAKVGQVAIDKYKEKFLKEEVVNFSQETHTKPAGEYAGEGLDELLGVLDLNAKK